MSIVINDRKIGKGHPPYLIAELSANHNGSLDRALQTILAAKNCGADAIKFQTYTAESMTVRSDRPEFLIKGGLWDGWELYDLYKWAQTPYEWHQPLFEYAKKIGITAFSTPFDETAVDFLEKLKVPAYKIASFEMTDLPLIKYVAQTGKPIIMSTGMANEEEVEEAVECARKSGCKELVLLHCISSYPTPASSSNLKNITNIKNKFNIDVGLSDHSMGVTVAIAGVAMGACLLEKHLTLNRKDKGPDSEFSLEPDEFKVLCKESNNAWLSLGTPGFIRNNIEDQSKKFRRSIYFAKDLPSGHTITKEDIRKIRPAMGLKPKYIDKIIGQKLITPVKKFTPVALDHFNF
jgi:pseudaminic acid synthase